MARTDGTLAAQWSEWSLSAKLIQAERSVRVADLSRRLGVSEATIRNDLAQLEQTDWSNGRTAARWFGELVRALFS